MRIPSIAILPLCLLPVAAAAATGTDLTATGVGWAALAVFVIAYALVIGEEFPDRANPSRSSSPPELSGC